MIILNRFFNHPLPLSTTKWKKAVGFEPQSISFSINILNRTLSSIKFDVLVHQSANQTYHYLFHPHYPFTNNFLT